jgi:hypothetical protein
MSSFASADSPGRAAPARRGPMLVLGLSPAPSSLTMAALLQ